MLTRRMRPPTIAILYSYQDHGKNRDEKTRTERLEEVVPNVDKSAQHRWARENGETYLRKSRWGCAECTDHQLLANTLKILKTTTRNAADHFALKPMATMTHAARPIIETRTRAMLHSPCRMNPRNRKIKRTRPARRKLYNRQTAVNTRVKSAHYFLRSVSLIVGKPANGDFRETIESLNTMNRPPMTLKLRRKKLRSKMRP